MKIKRLLLLPPLAAICLLLTACPKTKNVVPPEDHETQSAVQASYMNYLVSDMEMLISFVGEGQQSANHHFYDRISPAYGDIEVEPVDAGTSLSGTIRVAYNHALCKDGRKRHGSIYLDYSVDPQHPNARYIRAYKFTGKFKFSDYTVDDYKIDLADNSEFIIKNSLPTATYSPVNTNLTWNLDGKLKFTHLTDNTKDMTWEGHWVKTLANTANTLVVSSPTTAINWYNAEIYYTGTTKGVIPVSKEDGVVEATAFEMVFDRENPLRRNFQCSPDAVLMMNLNAGNASMSPVANEQHPFVSGIVSFTVGNAYPRQIYYGNEGQRARLTVPQCDNSGEVLIKGVSYPVDFMK